MNSSQSTSTASPVAKAACHHDDARAVLERLRTAGHTAYFAGGCVRDLLLGREPKDWDVATDASPSRVRALFPNTQAVGAAFGVILVRHRGSVVEVATFRADAEYIDGRHPTGVRFTTAEEDARRRDFTINGLFLDPLRNAPLAEQVIDHVGGRADLAGRLIRAIGEPDARFNEDHLRMLRAVRFAARFDFTIEAQTASAIRAHAGQLIRISPERIADELRTMLTPATRGSAYRMLEELCLRALLFRFLELPAGDGRIDHEKSVFAALAPGENIGFGVALAAASIDHYLWHGPANADIRRFFERPVALKIVRALRQSLKISNDESEDLEGALIGLDPLLGTTPPRLAVVMRFLAEPTSRASRALLESGRVLGLLDAGRVQLLQEQLADLEKTEFAPIPFVTGDDLAKAGLTPGPIFKRILDTVYDAQLEQRVVTKEDALALALSVSRAY
ncbi:MAG TPA: CCA tRNA nucleotidyltransferase [Tepidisphaeraceae bacterium]|jgi:poly(A) polymerase|nr:CCA tRNA nucleotidyltransferase [Tepidisphaeraceae bacterium]